MNIWAIADLHLNISVPEKTMEVFSPTWKDYVQKIGENWKKYIQNEDLVLIPGDICWAASLDVAMQDLLWIDALPGTKLLLKGNHDFWWSSIQKMEKQLPSSLKILQNNAFSFYEISIGGSRLWDSEEYNFKDIINFTEKDRQADQSELQIQKEFNKKIYARELIRLELSLKQLDPSAKLRIAMTHYPPIGYDLAPSRASKILEKYKVDICIFGHLHSVEKNISIFGKKNGIEYFLIAADYIDFIPKKIARVKQA